MIDVRVTAPGVLAANLSGCVAANAYLVHTGAASESFELAQEIEITCSDPRVTACTLTFDSTLIGYIRSKHRASACVKVAAAALDAGKRRREARFPSPTNRTAWEAPTAACATRAWHRWSFPAYRWASMFLPPNL